MSKISRRIFLESAAALMAAAAAPAPLAAAGRRRRVSPNEKLRVACVGFNGRGMSHVGAFAGMDDVEVVALCDVDTATFDRALRVFTTRDLPEPRTYQDMREMLEKENLDIVSISTTNHWHALQSIWAMQAGCDVYVEKPASHNIFEGRKMVEAARKYGRICQVGTQSRSNPGIREAIAYLHAGHLGKIHLARGLCYKQRDSIGRVSSPQEPPPTVNYDLWLGPAPRKPVMRQRFHYDWHWQWDYGNGDLGNQGSHEMDKARWGLNKNHLPFAVTTVGGRFGYRDDGETPNTELSIFDYGDCKLIFEVRGLSTPDLMGVKVGNIWYGEEGILVAPSYSSAFVLDRDGKKVKEFSGSADHFRNFVDVVRSRRLQDLSCDVEDGHLSAALCHMANISYLMGRQQPFSVEPGIVREDGDAAEALERFKEHLAANNISLDRWSYRVGPTLRFDPRREQFVDNERANRLLTREYRAPYVVPERV